MNPSGSPTGPEPAGHHSTDEEFRLLVETLIVLRELPGFYFYLEAKNAGVPPQVYRNWHPQRWPTSTIPDHQAKMEILHAMIQVQIRLWPYPSHETYWQSHALMMKDMRKLLAKGITTNQIAQASGITYKTVAKLLQHPKDQKWPAQCHCPWEIRRKLKDVEPRLFNPVSKAQEKAKRTKRYATPSLKTPALDIHNLLQEQTIAHHGNCSKCESNWSNLAFDGTAELIPFHHQYHCRLCSRTNFTQFPQIMRMAPCAHCNAPWTILELTGMHPNGQQIRTCRNCQRKNTTAPPAAVADLQTSQR